MNRLDCAECFHEPRGGPYYWGDEAERGSKRYAGEPFKESHGDICESIVAAKSRAPKGSVVFIKDMAYYLTGADGEISKDRLAAALDVIDHNTFLIRTPTKQVPSYYKMSTEKPEVTGWTNFVPEEVGYAELFKVYSTACDRMMQKGLFGSPVVVDADDLLASPEATLRQFCGGVGIPFEADRMLHWDPNDKVVKAKFESWQGWHDSAISSCGFDISHTTVRSPPKEDEPAARKQVQPQVVVDCIESAMPIYQLMHSVRVHG